MGVAPMFFRLTTRARRPCYHDMSEHAPVLTYEPSSRKRASLLLRLSLLVVLIGLAIAAAYVVLKTPLGARLRDRQDVGNWVRAHRVIAPAMVISLYVVLTVL